jgi:NADPH:quinone reductase-like Zn-dependent oxidoreductase
MRAVITENYGSPPTVAEVPTPTAGPGQIRVKIRASSLNGFDTALTRGFFRGMMDHQFPIVLGKDFAGTVDQIGDDVTGFALGDEVFGVVMTFPLNEGGFGEYVVLPESPNVAPIPAGLDHATAGAIGLAGAAATNSIDALAPKAGETVLISGATGGVGAIAMQLAAARGATIIATAAPGVESEHVRSLGATHVVDYTGDVPAQVRAIAPDGVDAVLHAAGDPFALADLLAAGGRLATLLGLGQEAFGDRPITVTSIFAAPVRPLLETLAGEIAGGRMRMPISRTYTLDEVPQAFTDFANGTLGKLAVRIS